MGRRTQAFADWNRRVLLWLGLAAALPLAGCGTAGFSLEDAAPDRSAVTGSIGRGQVEPAGGPAAAASDEDTIRNAVSSAIVGEIGAEGIGWANAATGSRGAVRQISERRDGSRLCRSFTASRESFDGVHLYRGEACLGAAKIWTMTAFDRVALDRVALDRVD